MSLEKVIKNFIGAAREQDENLFPFMANVKKFNEEKDSVYYSGPYWDDREIEAMFFSVLKGKRLSAGEDVNRFEKRFSRRFNKKHSVGEFRKFCESGHDRRPEEIFWLERWR